MATDQIATSDKEQSDQQGSSEPSNSEIMDLLRKFTTTVEKLGSSFSSDYGLPQKHSHEAQVDDSDSEEETPCSSIRYK